MPYRVKELYYTLQGEGRHTGRAAVFCRFTGCNLWSGREVDRDTARCTFCDTDFVGTDGLGGGTYTDAAELSVAIAETWKAHAAKGRGAPFVVFTGGEPLLQLDEVLVAAVHETGIEVAVETNGTRPCPDDVDWLCVSPKADTELVLLQGNELKLVFPQAGAEPEKYAGLAYDFFYLQPMDGPDAVRNTRLAVEYCLAFPQWRLSLQYHKQLGIP